MFISSLPIALRMFFVLHVVVKGTKTISLKVLHLGQEEYAIQMKILLCVVINIKINWSREILDNISLVKK